MTQQIRIGGVRAARRKRQLQSQAEDLAGEEDDTISEKKAGENEDRLHADFYLTPSSMDFFKKTYAHLGALICNETTYLLGVLRDTELSPETVGRLKAGQKTPGIYQMHHVHLKAVIVYKYIEAYINLFENHTHFLHGVINTSPHQPAKALREYIGASAGRGDWLK